jgi:hypothetical protein
MGSGLDEAIRHRGRIPPQSPPFFVTEAPLSAANGTWKAKGRGCPKVSRRALRLFMRPAKSRDQARDPDMRQAKNGNLWFSALVFQSA